MTNAIDLDAYFDRIGYSGPAAPTLDTLAALHVLHPAAIPFENLDPLLRRPVRLDLPSLQQKLVTARRGGYCYEQNLLFSSVLRAIGFQVRGLGARVLWNSPDDVVRPRSHMLLRVDIEGTQYLADVGFGGLTMTGPLRLEPDIEQPTPHEVFRLVRMAADYVMQARVGGAWRTLLRFDEQEQLAPDYEVANWYTSTHPESIFLRGLMAARAVPGERYALLNADFAIYRDDREPERRTLGSGTEILETLEGWFGIAAPRDAGLEEALDRLVPAAAVNG